MAISPLETVEGHRLRLPRRAAIAWAFLGLILLAASALAGAGWYYSSALKSDALDVSHEPDALDVEVVQVIEGRIELRPVANGKEWERDGVYGLAWADGFAPVGRILELGERRVVREWPATDGTVPIPPPGTRARLDGFAFATDPLVGLGLAFTEVEIAGPLSPLPAWLVQGDPRSWVIFVHGKGAERREALRALRPISAAGPTCLVISYRNDVGVAPDPSGRYRYGETEWEDLEVAVRFARAAGAERIVLFGYSMGGAIVLSFMDRSPLTDAVAGLVLEAPMISLEASVEAEAERRNLPSFLTAIGKQVAAWRFDLNWDSLDYRSRARLLDVPILLIHGSDDDRTPVSESDALAAELPDVVRYERFEGASHVRSWNVDPVRYEAAVGGFVANVLAAR